MMNGNGAQPPQSNPQMVIVFLPNGDVGIGTNPPDMIRDKIMCYGMLERARDAVQAFDSNRPVIQQADPNLLKLLQNIKPKGA